MMRRNIKIEKVFEGERTFEALHAAEKWCIDNGYSYGSTCACAPQAIKKGNWAIAKWKNLTPSERNDIDGTITGEGRQGPVTVKIFE